MPVEMAIAVLNDLGFKLERQKGSSVTYVNAKDERVFFHMPHPGNVLNPAAIKSIHEQLANYGIKA
jgi:predicted RNA binding protein YcfA (HicA-like mRNA interferase family)